ncbi:hypothetical protein BROUX41_004190 [Berkeleyomyces rouxiae]|uniref:uncharacterized protein n=1 Tax=Berkeleyomyces rouxiae TaxID=2035830 RepID=UPI003B79D7A1
MLFSTSESNTFRHRKQDGKASAPSTASSSALFGHLYFMIYDAYFLTRYDFWVLKLTCSYIWRCSTRHILLPFFARHFSTNHLDIGVGTGYFPSTSLSLLQAQSNDDAGADQRIGLWDLSVPALGAARARILASAPAAHVVVVKADATQPLSVAQQKELSSTSADAAQGTGLGRLETRFDSVSASLLLHCVPGQAYAKTRGLARNVACLLKPDGVFFGCTVVSSTHRVKSKPAGVLEIDSGVVLDGDSRVNQGRFVPWLLMWVYNVIGIFCNIGDNPDAIVGGLEESFETVESWVVGTVLLFRARNPYKNE